MSLPDGGRKSLNASCLQLSQLLLENSETSLPSILSSIGYVLIDLFTEVKALNNKKNTRDTVNKMLPDYQNLPPEKIGLSKKHDAFVVPSPPDSNDSGPLYYPKRVFRRPISLASESSIEYLSARPDPDSDTDPIHNFTSSPNHSTSSPNHFITPRGQSVSSSINSASSSSHTASSSSHTASPSNNSATSPTTSDCLADCKSLIDHIDSEKKSEEQFYSASEKNEEVVELLSQVSPSQREDTHLLKQTLQIPARDHLSSDSETPRPHIARQSSFTRQKSFRKKKSRERPSVLDATVVHVPKRVVPLTRSSRSISAHDMKQPRSIQWRRSSDVVSSDDYLKSPPRFSSDDQNGNGDSSKSKKIIEKLVMGMVNTRLRNDEVPSHFSDFESEILPPEPCPDVILPEYVLLPELNGKRDINLVKSGSQSFLATSSDFFTSTRSFCKPLHSDFVPPQIPLRPARSYLTSCKAREVKSSKSRGGIRRFVEGRQKVDQCADQGMLLTSALRNVLAFAQIPSDGRYDESEYLNYA